MTSNKKVPMHKYVPTFKYFVVTETDVRWFCASFFVCFIACFLSFFLVFFLTWFLFLFIHKWFPRQRLKKQLKFLEISNVAQRKKLKEGEEGEDLWQSWRWKRWGYGRDVWSIFYSIFVGTKWWCFEDDVWWWEKEEFHRVQKYLERYLFLTLVSYHIMRS